MLTNRLLLIIVLISCIVSCKRSAIDIDTERKKDSLNFSKYIAKGDSVYSQKNNYTSFAFSLKYYDSAMVLAIETEDTMMLAEATFAKARVYDAWNKEPLKTIEYFKAAADLFKGLSGKFERYMYVKQLVAHAYDKIKDTTNTLSVLRELYSELSTRNDNKQQNPAFTSEMALISTEVGGYELADSILNNLTNRSLIKNDPNTYDYLDHYYLTKSRIDIYYNRIFSSKYLDSLELVYAESSNLPDSIYYSYNLAALFAYTNNINKAYKYVRDSKDLTDIINNSGELGNMVSALQESKIVSERRDEEFRELMQKVKVISLWSLIIVVLAITVLSFYLYKSGQRYKLQSRTLAEVNDALDNKITQVELLNKEIQHRIKNNLHMVYSLLDMQERKSENIETIESLKAAKLRVESISSLHNHLSIGKGSMDFSNHVKNIVSSVINCLANDKSVITHLSIEDISIPVNECFALSLILNECLTNSVKYAQSTNNVVEISVNIKSEQNSITMEYFDSGINTHVPTVVGLGSQLISLLSKQLKATLVVSDSYHYKLIMPYGR